MRRIYFFGFVPEKNFAQLRNQREFLFAHFACGRKKLQKCQSARDLEPGELFALLFPFHRGEFGWWNQALLLLFGIGVLFSLVSGWVMFFKRRAVRSLGLPRLLPGAWKSTPIAAWVGAVALCALMPVLAISAAVVVILEIWMHRPWRVRNVVVNT